MTISEKYKAAFENYLKDNTFRRNPYNLYEPANYILSTPGKRFRPLLLLNACHLFSSDFHKAMPAALAVETFHNFTLMHDDIMDKADLRRGNECVHKKYGLNTAILSGDLMMIYSYKYLSDLEQEIGQALIPILNKAAIGVCEGQQDDIDFEEKNDVSIPQYITMIQNKTAVLLAASLQLGARIGGASEDEQNHLYEFGRKTGIAFQLQDDYLDVFGDTQKVGKKAAGDIIQNKKTYLYLKALEVASENIKNRLVELYKNPTLPEEEADKITEVKGYYSELKIPSLTRKLIAEYKNDGLAELQFLNLDKEKLQPLYELGEALSDRAY